MSSYQHSVLIEASSGDVFRVYSDVANWKTWDPEVEWSSLEGPFAKGSKGRLKPRGAPVSAIYLTGVKNGASFTVESRLPLCRMVFEHELTSNGNRTEALHRVTFTGFLSFLFGFLIGRQINKGFPKTLLGLKEKCEGLNTIKPPDKNSEEATHMIPELVTVHRMNVVGLEIRTRNQEEMNPATAKIPGVWGRFHQENLPGKVPGGKPGCAPIGVYSKYETDHTGHYSLLVGVEAPGPDVPAGLSGVTVLEGQYLVFPVRGPMPQSLIQTWVAIWDYFSKDLTYKRAYTTDFELYRGKDAVDIHIAVK
jgi:predicted transcriptional regulator YdeE